MIYEIYGPPGTGKSVHALSTLTSDKLCLYVNADFQLMNNIIDDSVYIVNSNDVSTIKSIITQLSDSVDTIIIDSLPMITNKEQNMDKVISDIQKILSICNRNKIDLYIINQYRANMYCEEYTYYLNRLKIYYHKRIKVG